MKAPWQRVVSVAALALAAGCGTAAVTPVPLAVHEVPGTLPGAAAPQDPLQGVNFLRVTLTGDDFGAVERTFAVDLHHAALPAAPDGDGRQILVEGCAASDCQAGAVSQGRTMPFAIRAGEPAPGLDVFLAPVNSVAYAAKPTGGRDPGPTGPSLPVHADRLGASLTVLDDGRLLIAGGAPVASVGSDPTSPASLGTPSSSVEVFDPGKGTFVEVGPMSQGRSYHEAVKLQGRGGEPGRVLLLGGYAGTSGSLAPTTSVDVFDPSTGKCTPVDKGNQLAFARARFGAALAYPGQDVVFLAGGDTRPATASSSWDLYHVDFGVVGHGSLDEDAPRWNHRVTAVDGWNAAGASPGRAAILVSGGEDQNGPIPLFEVYSLPVSADGLAQRDAGGYLFVQPEAAAMTRLPSGARTRHQVVYVSARQSVLVIGGFADAALTAVQPVDIYSTQDAAFAPVSVLLHTARGAHTATLLDGDTILVVGGMAGSGAPLGTTERIVDRSACGAGNSCAPSWAAEAVDAHGAALTPVLPGGRTRYGHLAAFDPTHSLFVFGGIDDQTNATTAVVFHP